MQKFFQCLTDLPEQKANKPFTENVDQNIKNFLKHSYASYHIFLTIITCKTIKVCIIAYKIVHPPWRIINMILETV